MIRTSYRDGADRMARLFIGVASCLTMLLGAGTTCHGAEQPSVRAPHEETIDVSAQALVPLSRRYQRIERVFRRFDSFPARDRQGLSLHMQARLEPGNRPGALSALSLKRNEGFMPLIQGESDEILLPHDAGIWQENPPFYARLKAGETLRVGFFFTIATEDRARFTGDQARHWLAQLDACVEDEGGFLVALMLPDTHRLAVDVAPRSRLEVRENGQVHLLIDNQGDQPYRYVLRPQDFSRGAQFVSTRPFVNLVMTLPFALHGVLERK